MTIMNPWQAYVLNDKGEPDPGASVEVVNEATGASPILYDGRDTATASSVGNPASADANGFVQFWMVNGRYKIIITGSDGGKTTFRDWHHWYAGQGLSDVDSVTFNILTITTQAALPEDTTMDGVKVATRDYVNERISNVDDWQDSVLAQQNDPPATPNDGDRYIVGTAPTGDWSANANDIAQWDADAGSWEFFTANVGMATLRESDDRFLTFNGTSWVVFGSLLNHNSMLSLQGGVSGEKYHLTAAQHTSVGNIVSAGHAEGMDQGVAQADSPTFASITIDDAAKNAQGAKTISTSDPSGGSNGDVWYKVAS